MSFEIYITRVGNSGIVTFSHGDVTVSATCWWDLDVVIDAGSYTGYATRMANKTDGVGGGNRQGIWLGTGVPYNNNANTSDQIFLHKGNNASWSDGCIVFEEAKLMAIWNEVTPKETANIVVHVVDPAVGIDINNGKQWNNYA